MSTYFTIPENRTIQDFYFEVTNQGLLSVTDLITNTTTVMPSDIIGVQNGANTHRVTTTGYPYGNWFSEIALINGQEVLITSTTYNRLSYSVIINTPPSPVLVLGVANGQLVNKTAQHFPETHWTHWTRDIHVGDIDGIAGAELFISNQGREVGSYTAAPHPRLDPVWGEQNAYFSNDNGAWKDVSTSALPRTADFSHGSTLADIDGNGDMEIIVNNLGAFDGNPGRYILDYQNGAMVIVRNSFIENVSSSFTESADFNNDGFDDVVVGNKVFMGGPNFGQTSLTLPETQFESIGFKNWHGGTTADFNNDGFADLLKISASNGDSRTGVSNWSGLRFGLHFFNGQQFEDKTANIGNYTMTDFGINMRALDIDFDGHLDIVTTGSRYFYGTTPAGVSSANIALRNDGTGRFEVVTLNLAKAANNMYYLKQDDFSYASLTVFGYNADFSPTGSATIVTPASINQTVGNFGAGASSIGGFDAHYYLHQYPEVSALITAGTYQSAHDHYVRAGAAQGKFAFAPGTWVWGTSGDNVLVLREGNEKAFAQQGNDIITGGAGNDVIDGGDGRDTAIYSGAHADFTIAANAAGNTVTSTVAGNDELISIERLQFSDKQVALDLAAGQSAGNTARLLGAAFGAAAVKNAEFAGIGIEAFDAGMSMAQLSEILASAFAMDNNSFVSMLYQNLTRAEISNAELVELASLLQGSGGIYTQGQLLEVAANIDLNVVNIDLIGLQQVGLVFV